MIGSLVRNSTGRFEVQNHEQASEELTSGNLVELYLPDVGWLACRVEHAHAVGYVAVGPGGGAFRLEALMPARTGRDMGGKA